MAPSPLPPTFTERPGSGLLVCSPHGCSFIHSYSLTTRCRPGAGLQARMRW